ncbi:antibiotic biosynthesis monooxygenase [Metapseudomonas otitidis]|uniref:antibiotic biosynthesis monooxygenase n=1 Tax=Metapseudomonas otitidis TaxID=319939 RepID=UPI00227A380D|nr:antibiotic biosynthesis monooxygenase [Pseudomonas otitidis]WAF88238.1 antibiotic biosynthesis monooxygenase [Pseudomonas otitidis]
MSAIRPGEGQGADDPVTLLIRHRVHAAHATEYEAWLRRIVGIAQGYPGHLGVDVIRSHEQGVPLFTSVLRFTGPECLQDWLGSETRRQLVAEISPLLLEDEALELNPAREFWFAPASAEQPPPPRWKQACVSFLVILPLSLLVPWAWQPAFAAWPWLGGYLPSNVVITLSIVLLVVYLFMPRVTRWLAPWLEGPGPGGPHDR